MIYVMETNLVLFVCCYDLHAGIEEKAIFLICPTMKLYAKTFIYNSVIPKYHHHHHHHGTSANLQWFSNERIMGYSDVLKAQSAMASITSCYKTNGTRSLKNLQPRSFSSFALKTTLRNI